MERKDKKVRLCSKNHSLRLKQDCLLDGGRLYLMCSVFVLLRTEVCHDCHLLVVLLPLEDDLHVEVSCVARLENS